jgi:hypothetical protein
VTTTPQTQAAPRRHILLIGAVIWLVLAAIVSFMGIPQRMVSPTPQIVVLTLTVLLLVASWLYWPLRSWVLTCDWRAIVEIHFIRLIAGAGFLYAGSKGRFPTQFATMAGWGDIAIGILGLLLILLVAPHRTFAPWAYGIWNTLGLLDILHVVMDASRNAMADRYSMAELLKPPFVFLPLFIVPILIASHIWLYERIVHRTRGLERE